MNETFDRTSQERYLRTQLANFPFDLQARLVEATSVQDVCEIGIAILARIPATVCIRIFQRDDSGQMALVHAWQSPLIDASEFEMDLKEISGIQLIPEVERAAIGIIREALQNVRKHAAASSVRLEVTRRDGELIRNVVDDGVGIDDPDSLSINHFGIVQMRELAKDLGGEISIVSEPGQGTRVEAHFPLVVPANGAPLIPSGSGLSASEYLSQLPPEPSELSRSGGGYDARECPCCIDHIQCREHAPVVRRTASRCYV